MREVTPAMGLDEAWRACLWASLVALALPVGAMIGLLASPISGKTVAACMAFGAGALIFAVAIELYSEAVNELRSGEAGRYELIISSICTVVGACIYTAMDRFLIHRPSVPRNLPSRFLQSDAPKETATISENSISGGDEPLIGVALVGKQNRQFGIILWCA